MNFYNLYLKLVVSLPLTLHLSQTLLYALARHRVPDFKYHLQIPFEVDLHLIVAPLDLMQLRLQSPISPPVLLLVPPLQLFDFEVKLLNLSLVMLILLLLLLNNLLIILELLLDKLVNLL